MPTYTVHAPPSRQGEIESAPERFRYVRDGFSLWAFLIPPLWLLAYRLWLALLIYAAGYSLIEVGLSFLRASWSVQLLVTILIGLLMGLEASSIERWTLGRRGWKTLGFVVAADEETAEQRFLSEWAKRPVARAGDQPAALLPAPPAEPQHYEMPGRREPFRANEVIGLFPQPGGSR